MRIGTEQVKQRTTLSHRVACILYTQEVKAARTRQRLNLCGSKSKPRLPRAQDEQRIKVQQQWRGKEGVWGASLTRDKKRQQFPSQKCSLEKNPHRGNPGS